MKIRDKFATLNGDTTEHFMPSGGIQIISDDGRSLFEITLTPEGSLEVSGGNMCRFKGKILDDCLSIKPKASNRIEIIKTNHM